jgi:hypothetical protein
MHMKLIDTFGNEVMATIVVTANDVYIRVKGDIVGQFTRSELAEWLADPVEEISSQKTSFMAVPNGIAIAVRDIVPMWPLRDDVERRLKVTVREANRVFPPSRLPTR